MESPSELTVFLDVLFRWLHIAAGILWIGLLYWFNFVNIPFAATMDGDTKKKVVPELIPRSLYFFRWGAAYTWVTGLLLLALVFYHGGNLVEGGAEATGGTWVMVAVVFLMFALYDALAKSNMAKNLKVFGVVAFIMIALVVYLMISFGMFSYRAYVIHTGAMFGTLMAANVWMRIWPGQRKVMAAIKEGTAPDAAVVAMVGQRSRHNTYMSVPLVWTMIEAHSASSITAESWLYLLAAILIGWGVVTLMYKKSAAVKGI